jgi:hypothetical protein
MSDPARRANADAQLVIRDDDGAAYAIPVGEVERYRMTPERRALVAAQLREQGTEGEAPIYEVDMSSLARYRLSQNEWTRLEATLHESSGDMRGFVSQGGLPDCVAVAPHLPGAATARSHVHTLPSWYWFNGGDGSRGGPQPGVR